MSINKETRESLIEARNEAILNEDLGTFETVSEALNVLDNIEDWTDINYEDACETGHKKKKMRKSGGKKKTTFLEEEEDEEESEKTKIRKGGKQKKKDSVLRVDRIDAPSWMTESFERTAEGFLKGRAIVTNIGVFSYTNPDGSIRRELRLPEEVFSGSSLSTLKMKPVTNDHPQEIVMDKNATQLSVGSLGSNPSKWVMGDGSMMNGMPYDRMTDGYHVAIDLMITDGNTIEDVLNGKRELSCGYNCDLEQGEPGAVWMGMPYDYIQRNIRYNHVAIVDKARAGDAARIRMDSAAAISNEPISYKIQEDKNMANLKKINFDGVDYEAEPEVIKKYTQAKERLDALEDQIKETEKSHKDAMSKIEAERDTANETIATLEEENKALKEDSVDDAKIQEKIDKRLKIQSAAISAGIEVKKDSTDESLQKEIIQAVFPKANLDDKDAIYIEARFESALELLDNMDQNDKDNRMFGGADNIPGDGEKRVDSKTAREKYIETMKERSRSHGE